MEGRNVKGNGSPFKPTLDCPFKSNQNVPKGLLCRELGHKQKLGAVSQEFQDVAEDKLVLKNHEELRCEIPGPSRSTFLMVFSPDGTKVASTHGNHNVYVTDLTTGKNVNTLSGHPRTPWCIAFHPSSNQILASGCLGGQVRVWDLHGGSEMWMADDQTVIASLAFHPTDRMLVIATYNELHFWDWSQPEPFTKCYTNNEKEKVRYVAFDPLGHKLITGISNAPQIQSQWDQWDRSNNQASNNSPLSPQHRTSVAPDRERRISVCYRSLVEQYEQLVQRYFDLSRSRSISTMDRGTDPMDFESEPTTISSRSRTTSGPSTSNNNSADSSSRTSRWRERNTSSATEERARSSNISNRSSSYAHLFHNPWQRHRLFNQTDSATATSETESGTTSGTSTTNLRHDPRWYLSPFPDTNPRNRYTSERASSQVDALRRMHAAFMDNTPSRASPSQNRDVLIVREDNYLRNEANNRSESNQDRMGNQERSTSPVFLPSVPRRFYVSQSSAFQPRTPRTDHSSEYGNSGRSTLPRRTTQRISLNAATAAAVAAVPERRTPDSPPRSHSPTLPATRSTSEMTDIGVRYGIQLLSRHIDNMQRLCRARLEILQLQQIRRMWEDLQHQIRSLHSAVRESSITLARLAESQAPVINNLHSSGPTPSSDESSSRVGLSRSAAESSSEANAGHIPSVSQMLELARISDNNPSSTRDTSSQEATEDNLSRVPEEEIFQPPDESSSLEGAPSANNSVSDPGLLSGNSPNDETNNQQYSFRCQMLQQRLWRISRKVHLRRPRLPTVNSRSMRRQLHSSHPSSNRGSSQSRHVDSSRQPWFLHFVARHRSKSTNNMSSQVDSSCPPGKSNVKNDVVPSSLDVSNQQISQPEIDNSQPGPSGLCSKPSSSGLQSNAGKSQKPWCDKARAEEDEEEDDDDDDDDDNVDEDNVNINKSLSCSKDAETKDDNEQLPPPKMRKIDRSSSRNTERESSQTPSNEPSAIRRRLLEEIDRLFPTNPSPPGSPTPSTSSAPSTSADNAEPSTSRGTGPPDRSNTREHSSACKSLCSMINRLERLLQEHREHRERMRNVLSDDGTSRRTNTWSLRDRFERIENSGSDSDSNTETERPRNWGRMSAEERLLNALQTETYERERMCRAAAGAQNGRGRQQEEEWEWTRESTRVRARQVLSLMVESLTQFFEENGLSSNTPHAVLDEQILNLHVLLQLALELTDLLLAQLVCTRRELEHQWVNRLRSPVALSAEDRHSQNSERERDSRSRGQQDEGRGSLRLPPYRRLYRHRLSDGDGSDQPERSRGNRAEYSPLLGARVINCLARHNRMSSHSGSTPNTNLQPRRPIYGRRNVRPLVTRADFPDPLPSHLLNDPRLSPSRVRPDRTRSEDVTTRSDNVDRPLSTSNNASNSSSSNIPTAQSHDAFTVPLVRVNDVLISDTSLLNQPRTRPQSPPLHHPRSSFLYPFTLASTPESRSQVSPWDYWPYMPGSSFRPRFLHPRYMGPNEFNDDSEEPVPNVNPEFGYVRAHAISETVFITDGPMTPNHRIQVWDFSKFQIPDISNAEKNIIVPECKIQNDASIDVSKDGRLLVTLLSSSRPSLTTMLGVYSLQWKSLGQCLYTTSFLQSPVSVSLSPASRYLLVGLASRRVPLLPNDRNYMAQVFRLDGGKPGLGVGGRGRLRHMRDIQQIRDQGYMSLNCIRWAPGPGQGFVYGTNTGQLKVLR